MNDYSTNNVPWPPTGPTGATKTIPSYLYQEYSDDSDLQAFVNAYNSMMQNIVDTFNGLNLPIYNQAPVNNGPGKITALMDWVGQGIYGYPRPSISSGSYLEFGTYNTCMYNQMNYYDQVTRLIVRYNDYVRYYPPNQLVYNDDDLYGRCLTWHISKREGKYFSVEWLKKRVAKFLYGENGTQPNIDQTYQISVTFGPNYEVTIRFVLGIRTITNAAMYDYNTFTYNSLMYNQIDTSYVALPELPFMQQFQDAVRSGVLELPFQFKFDVVIG
jgi:hypothetical protein